jgi:hypothetical protein
VTHPDNLKSLADHVRNIVDEQLHDLDPIRVSARKRLVVAVARGRQSEVYDFGSPLYGCPDPRDQEGWTCGGRDGQARRQL